MAPWCLAPTLQKWPALWWMSSPWRAAFGCFGVVSIHGMSGQFVAPPPWVSASSILVMLPALRGHDLLDVLHLCLCVCFLGRGHLLPRRCKVAVGILQRFFYIKLLWLAHIMLPFVWFFFPSLCQEAVLCWWSLLLVFSNLHLLWFRVSFPWWLMVSSGFLHGLTFLF